MKMKNDEQHQGHDGGDWYIMGSMIMEDPTKNSTINRDIRKYTKN